jgi:hypothetical protein
VPEIEHGTSGSVAGNSDHWTTEAVVVDYFLPNHCKIVIRESLFWSRSVTKMATASLSNPTKRFEGRRKGTCSNTSCRDALFISSTLRNKYSSCSISLRWHYCSFAFELAISSLRSRLSVGVSLNLPPSCPFSVWMDPNLAASAISLACTSRGVINHPWNGNKGDVECPSIAWVWTEFICYDLVVRSAIWFPFVSYSERALTERPCVFSAVRNGQ